MIYPEEMLYEETAFIAYYFHWGYEEIMALSHRDRKKWCRQISAINKSRNNTQENVFEL